MAKIFNIVTITLKLFSCIFAVASGLFAGSEGPMISIGAGIGAGISRFRSKTLGFSLSFITRFRNPRDQRDFVSAG